MSGSPTPRHFAPAPWPASLKVTSALGAVGVPILTSLAFRAVPAEPGFTRGFGLVIAAVLPLALLASVLLVVTGYVLDGRTLRIRRLLWSTCLPLAGLQRAWSEPAVSRGSHRIFGNAGLFSYTGLYQHRAFGRYRMFATDLRNAVVLAGAHRKVVITPAAPAVFLEHLRALMPTVTIGAHGGDV